MPGNVDPVFENDEDEWNFASRVASNTVVNGGFKYRSEYAEDETQIAEPWQLNEMGKYAIGDDGKTYLWAIDDTEEPHHAQVFPQVDFGDHGHINPDGTIEPYRGDPTNMLNAHSDLKPPVVRDPWGFAAKTASAVTPPNCEPWQMGQAGKALISNGKIYAWATNANPTDRGGEWMGAPHHGEVEEWMGIGNGGGFTPNFYIDQDGGVEPIWDAAMAPEVAEAIGGHVMNVEDEWQFKSSNELQVIDHSDLGEPVDDYHNHKTGDRPWIHDLTRDALHLGPKNWYHADLEKALEKKGIPLDLGNAREQRASEYFMNTKQYHPDYTRVQDALVKHLNWQYTDPLADDDNEWAFASALVHGNGAINPIWSEGGYEADHSLLLDTNSGDLHIGGSEEHHANLYKKLGQPFGVPHLKAGAVYDGAFEVYTGHEHPMWDHVYNHFNELHQKAGGGVLHDGRAGDEWLFSSNVHHNWTPGEIGKGFVLRDGTPVTWNTEREAWSTQQEDYAYFGPHHNDVTEAMGLSEEPSDVHSGAERDWHTPVYINSEGEYETLGHWPGAVDKSDLFQSIGLTPKPQSEDEWEFTSANKPPPIADFTKLDREMNFGPYATDPEKVWQALQAGWTPGKEGKGLLTDGGDLFTWNTWDDDGNPHHFAICGVLEAGGIRCRQPGYVEAIYPDGGFEASLSYQREVQEQDPRLHPEDSHWDFG